MKFTSSFQANTFKCCDPSLLLNESSIHVIQFDISGGMGLLLSCFGWCRGGSEDEDPLVEEQVQFSHGLETK